MRWMLASKRYSVFDMTLTSRAALLTTTFAIAAIALTGCSPAEPESEAPDESSGSTTGGYGGGSDDEFDPVACVLGEWTISQEQMQLFYDQVSAGVEGATFNVRGTTDLVFGDTEYSYFPGFSLELEISGMYATATMSGAIDGDYVVDGGEITTNNDHNFMSMSVDAAGFDIDGTELASEMLSASPVTSAPYECRSGPELVIEMETGYGRVPIVLVPDD